MSNSPFEPAQPQDHAFGPDDTARPPVAQAPAARSGRGRTVALVGGILAIVAVGAGGTYAFQQVSGGGAQPESVMPASTIAFAKVDLDPSAGQKLDAIRFVRKFPKAKDKVEESSDLREVIFKGLQDEGKFKGVDYVKDVEPWLGQRLGFGAIAGAGEGAQPTAIIALAVTDKEAAGKSLPQLAASFGGGCQVVEDYAVCTDKDRLAAVVAATEKGTLADSANFAKDMGDLGEDGVASAWFDSPQLVKAAGSLGAASMFGLAPGGPGPTGQGRLAMALRFDGPHLELAGHLNDSTTKFVGDDTAGSLADLPKGTLAAVGIANAGEQLKAGWPELEKNLKGVAGEQAFAEGLAAAEDSLGITLPDDLYAALGSQFTLAFGGLGEAQSDLKVAMVTNGDKVVLQKLADAAGEQMGAGGLALKSAGQSTVLSLSDGYADEITSGAGLGDTAAFKDAVEDLDHARLAAYVDIAGVLATFKDEIPAEDAKDFAGLSAVGVTASGEGTSGDFALRLTTK
jgi:hypothetical protein